MPYILTTRPNWSSCKLRVFCLANRKEELDNEQQKYLFAIAKNIIMQILFFHINPFWNLRMAAMLSKFRIDYSDVIVITDITKKPADSTRAYFDNLTKNFVKNENGQGKLKINKPIT